MKALKVVAFILGCIFIFFGSYGFLSCFSSATTDNKGVLVSSLPINDANGIVVDSKGNIYIGDAQSSSVQVFSNTGQFLYGFSFPTGGAGWFAFGIDDQDIIHIVTARTDSYFQYLNGERIYSESIDSSRQEQLEKAYKMSSGNSFDFQNKKYSVSSRNVINIHSLSSNDISEIKLNTPFWPLSIFTYWLILACGTGLWFWSFAWKLIKSLNLKQ